MLLLSWSDTRFEHHVLTDPTERLTAGATPGSWLHARDVEHRRRPGPIASDEQAPGPRIMAAVADDILGEAGHGATVVLLRHLHEAAS